MILQEYVVPWVYGICVELNPRLTRVRRVSTAAYIIFMFFFGENRLLFIFGFKEGGYV